MEKETPMTEQESLRLIHQMIDSSKKAIRNDGSIYLMWGWLVLFSTLAHYYLLTQTSYQYPYIVWLSMPLAGVLTAIIVIRKEKKKRVQTNVDEFMAYLWWAFGVSMIILMVFMSKIGYDKTYPILILFYGMGTFVSGGALRFKPLIIGGALNWLIAIWAFNATFEHQILLLGLAVVCSYIIPGHLLKINAKK